jgi:hypothetical protein
MKDKLVRKIIRRENKRQNNTLELIASENFASKEVRKMMSSCLTNKYAEGYPYARYYGGCQNIDQIETLAIYRAKKLFNAQYANVQPHSGSQANAAAYKALENYLSDKLTNKYGKKRKMKILTMDLNSGAHLTHGSKVSFSSNDYDFSFFKLDQDGKIDFNNTAKDIVNLIRGLNPWPIAFTKYEGKTLKIYSAEVENLIGNAGEVILSSINDGIVVGTKDKALKINELQLEGSRKMTVKEFLVGRKIPVGYKFGE